MRIKAEIGTSGRIKEFELTGNAADDVAYAVEEEHPCEDTTSCDIAMALENGFPFSAAFLLKSATETPFLDKVTQAYYEEFWGIDGMPKDWDNWVDWYKENTWKCLGCGNHNHVDSDTCGNCLAARPDDDEDE